MTDLWGLVPAFAVYLVCMGLILAWMGRTGERIRIRREVAEKLAEITSVAKPKFRPDSSVTWIREGTTKIRVLRASGDLTETVGFINVPEGTADSAIAEIVANSNLLKTDEDEES